VPLAELAAPAGVAPAALPVPVLLAGAVLVPLLGVVGPELELLDEPDVRLVPLLEVLPYPPDPLVEEPVAVVSVWQAASMPAASVAATVACRSRVPCICSLLRWMGYRARRHMPCRVRRREAGEPSWRGPGTGTFPAGMSREISEARGANCRQPFPAAGLPRHPAGTMFRFIRNRFCGS
jgi:hypothetical protein